MLQTNSRYIEHRSVVSRFAAKLAASDGALLALCQRWEAESWRVARVFARFGEADPPVYVTAPMFARQDGIQQEIADTPAQTRRGLSAKAKTVLAILDDVGSDLGSYKDLIRSLAADAIAV